MTEVFLLLAIDRTRHHDHIVWWRPNGAGYTDRICEAGRYSSEQARARYAGGHDPDPIPVPVTFLAAAPNVIEKFEGWEVSFLSADVVALQSLPTGSLRERAHNALDVLIEAQKLFLEDRGSADLAARACTAQYAVFFAVLDAAKAEVSHG